MNSQRESSRLPSKTLFSEVTGARKPVDEESHWAGPWSRSRGGFCALLPASAKSKDKYDPGETTMLCC